MKKYVVWTLVLGLLFVLSGVAWAQKEIQDLSPGHWAYDSVKYLVDRGYFSLYEDGTFRGNQPVTRYELAVILARILNNIEQQKVTASAGDMETLRKLTIEFRDELVQIAREQEIFQEKIENLQEEDVILQEDINGIYLEVRKMIKQIQEVAQREKQREEQIASLQAQVDSLKDQLKQNQAAGEELQKRISTLEEEIIYLQQRQASMDSYIENLKTTLSGKQTEVKDLQTKNEQMKWIMGGAIVLALLLSM